MLISASFLSSENIPKDLEKLNETDIDYIHVDVMDGKYVERKTLSFRQMKHIGEYTSKRLDVHLMVKKPSKYIDDYASLNTEFITIHPDIVEDVIENLKRIKSYAIKAGIAVNPDVPLKEIIPYLPYVDLILIMGVFPGRGGQEFISSTEEKVKEARVLLKEYNEMKILVSVDGGINEITRQKVEQADLLVSGSYIIKKDSFQEAISSLR